MQTVIHAQTVINIQTDKKTGIDTQTVINTQTAMNIQTDKHTVIDIQTDKHTDSNRHMGWLRLVGSLKL